MRIAIVNDMALAVEAIRRILVGDGRHKVVWTARDGAEAVAKCAADKPDLILMDLLMPVMDGVEATRRIMEASPCAILVVTATVNGLATRVYEALGAGALDAVETPNFGSGSMLLMKLEMLERRITPAPAPVQSQAAPAAAAIVDAPATPQVGGNPADWLVAVGASAGGPAALSVLLAALPADFPGAIVIVQHIDTAFAAGLISWLARQCALPVSLARDGEWPLPGHVYIASGDRHIVIDAAGRLAQTSEPAQSIYLPGIDVFFKSMAQHWRRLGAGVLLTGMGRDGAQGLLALREAGFTTLAQDRESSAVYGMPKAAAELGAASLILTLREIAPRLVTLPTTVVRPARRV